jgi:hypothetical protein
MAEAPSIKADNPLVLLPVRLETRFFGTELWIRIYPDTVHIDSHEPELTQDELLWGRHFHEQLWRAAGDEPQRKAAWRQLAERLGASRAGWVARQLTPLNENERPQSPLSPTQPLTTAPRFPDVPKRSEAEANETWTRAPWSCVLPDRWFASAFSGGELVTSVTGQEIPDPLPVGPDPKLTIADNPAGSPVDEGIRWMVDFAAAEKIGMALKMALPPLAAGTQRIIDRLIVVGTKNSLDAAVGASRLAELLQAHQYTDGLAVLEQGTPTNNAEDSPSAFASEDPAHERSARWFLSGPRFQRGDGSNGDELAEALGVPIDAFTRTTGAERREQIDARRMHRALWPATWGYYLEQMLYGVFPDADIDASLKWGRDHFVDFVRAGGPLPSLRIGKQPYGLLPVTLLMTWQPAPGEQVEPARDTAVVNFLRRQRQFWLNASAQAPRMGRNNDPDKDFPEVFRMDAVSSQYMARNTMGEKYVWHLLGFFGMFPLTGRANVTFQTWHNEHVNQARAALNQTGLGQEVMASRLAMALHFEMSESVGSLARMDADGSAELVFNQLDRLAKAQSLDAVLRHDGVPTPYSMIYLMARHALLLEYAGAAARLLNIPPRARVEDDQIGFTRLANFETLLGRIIRAALHIAPAFSSPADGELKDFREALQHLKNLPAQQLDLLLRAALDLSSHRLDAWITSFATKRLKHIRRERPAGAYIGGYGWLENLRPANPSQPAPPPPGPNTPATTAATNPGFVHSPSLEQAATVAVLRSGHLTHAAGGKQDLLAIDLSSERARLARWLLDGVRAGQAPGALLGYRFERGLHENHPGFFLDRFIAPLRDLAPLTATRIDASGQPVESVPAKHVVDGLKLFRLWQAQPDFLRTAIRLSPPPTPAEFAALEAELAALAQAVDAVSDALIAESVHQVVHGNPVRAAATLDAIERGEAPPPELEVLRTPRSGSAFTHRVVVLCATNSSAARWSGGADLPRAVAEPALNAWVANLLGDPRLVRCRIERWDPAAAAAAPLRELRLSELRLSPLDVLYASESTDELHQSDLEQQVLYQARRSVPDLPGDAVLKINPGREPSWPVTDLSWSEFTAMADAARRLLSASRPLQAADLTLDQLAASDGIDAADVQQRADAAVTRLRGATTALHDTLAAVTAAQLDPVRETMLALTNFGIAGAIPVSASGNTEDDREALLFQGQSLEKEANSRLARIAESERALAAPGVTTEARIELHRQRLHEVFGKGFLLLPRFRAPNDADLSQALAASASVQGGDPFAALTFHQRMARVREAISHFDDLLRYAEALGGEASLTLEVLQLPFHPGDRWIGLPATPEHPLASGRLSIIAHLAGAVDFTKPVAGLMIDEWIEVVPNAGETTGVVFQSNQPDSCPPQVILVAVPPNPAAVNNWTEPSLVQLLQETLDLVRIRAVTPDVLQEFSQYLPALYFPLNVAGDTISTDFVVPG